MDDRDFFKSNDAYEIVLYTDFYKKAKPEKFFEMAEDCYLKKCFLNASLLLRDGIKRKPEDPYKYYRMLGHMALFHVSAMPPKERGSARAFTQEAAHAYRSAFHCRPTDFEVAHMASTQFFCIQDFASAELYAEHCLLLQNDHKNAHALRALSCIRQEKYDEDVFRSAIEHADDSELLSKTDRAMLRYGLVKALEFSAGGEGDYFEMEGLMKEAVSISGANCFFVLKLAEFFLRHKEHPDLIKSGKDIFYSLKKADYYARRFIEANPCDYRSADVQRAQQIIKDCMALQERNENFESSFLEAAPDAPGFLPGP